MHILHLEDDGPLREILATALKAAVPGCDLHQFANSDEAVTYAAQYPDQVDLFILDIRVPGTLNGLEVAQKLRELKCAGTIVVTSAYRVPDRAILEGCQCQWFPKPWHIMETTRQLITLASRKTPPSD